MEKLKSWLLKLLKVLVTLIIWLGLALAAATIVALIPSVGPCLQRGFTECRTAIRAGLPLEPEKPGATSAQPAAQTSTQQAEKDEDGKFAWFKHFMDWVILVVSLIIAVRIMYPPEDLIVPPQKPGPAPER